MLPLLRLSLLIGIRHGMSRALLLGGLAVVGIALLATGFSGRQPVTVGLDVGFTGMRVLLAIIMLAWVQLLLAQDIERKSVYFVLSYPLSRVAFILLRFSALAFLSAVSVALLGLGLWLALTFLGSGYEQLTPPALGWPYALVLFGIWLDLLVIAAFAVLISTVSTTPNLTLLLGLAFMLAARSVGPVIDYLRREASAGYERWYAPLLEYSHYWFPDLTRLDWRDISLYALPVNYSELGLSALMGSAYCVFMLALACIAFQRRDFT